MQVVPTVAVSLRAFLVRATSIVFAIAALAAASAAHAECFELFGIEYCGPRKPNTQWTIGICHEAGSFGAQDIAWCRASGGTWNNGCHGEDPVNTEGNMYQRVTDYLQYLYGGSCSITGDTGWHATYQSYQCSGGNAGPDGYAEGWLTATFRQLAAHCDNPTRNETFSTSKRRGLGCDPGYTEVNLPYYGYLCARNVECPSCGVGNPVLPGTGVKTLTETDYRHALGLEFTRHYHSFRFYEAYSSLSDTHTPESLGSAWRTNYDKRIIDLGKPREIITDGSLSWGISYPTGEVQYFTASGVERVKYGIPTTSLFRAPTNEFFLLAPDRTEQYGIDGRLRSIAYRDGKVLTLTYSDGTTGPNGGYVLDESGNPTTFVLVANRLLRVSDAQGNTLSFAYDKWDRIARMTDPSGAVYKYTYDDNSNLTQVTYPDTKTRVYRYNEPANMVGGGSIAYALTSVVDENGDLFATYKYDTTGKAVVTEHAGGANHFGFTYNAGSTQITDALNTPRDFSFSYNANSDAVTRFTSSSLQGGATYASGVKARTYDSNGNLASSTDFNDNKTCYSYLPDRGLESVRVEGLPAATDCATVLANGATLPAGSRKIVTEWHARWQQPLRISEPLRRTTFVYNGEGATCAPAEAVIPEGTTPSRPIGVVCTKTAETTADTSGGQGFAAATTGQSRAWAYTYNVNGSVLTVDGPRTDLSDVTTYTYYANDDPDTTKRGNVATITNALGHPTNITAYNAHGRPLTIVDPNSVSTTLTYDARQRLRTRTIGTEQTTYDYDFAGQLTRVNLPDGSYLSYTYDAAHRLTDITDNAGNLIHYTLDGMGNRTGEEVRDPASQLAQTRTRVYNSLNRLFQELGAQSQTTEYGYDTQGNVTSVKDPLNQTTVNQYDALNRLKQVTSPAPISAVTQYAYNGLDALTKVTDPRTLETSYTVDGLGNLTQQSSPDTGATVNAYDSAGNLFTQTDAKSQSTTYAYDALNRVTLITFHDSSKQAYAYDQGANGIGRLSSVTETNPASQVTSVIAYAYDSHGRVSSETRTVAGVQYATGYRYDTAGRLDQLTYPSGRTVAYNFDTLGRVSGVTTTPAGGSAQSVVSNVAYHPFGGVKAYALGNGRQYTRGIDLDGRIASYTLGTQAFAIGYDNASRISFISETGNPPNSNTYGYDNLDRLTSAITPVTSYGYIYDAVGNRNSRTAGSSTDTYTNSTTSNRIAFITPPSGPVRNFVFDLNGSTTADGNSTYTYDTRGRMVQSTSAIGSTTYQVNALGQRARKTSSLGDSVFHYDTKGRLIAETSPSGGLKRELIYLGDIPVGVVQ